MALQLSVAARNAMLAGLTTEVGSAGVLRIFTGSVPANCAAASTGTQLYQQTLGSPFAPAASGGVLSPTIPANANASATGTAGYYRVFQSGGTVCVQQGTCGTSGTDMILNTTSLTSGGPVQINSWTITQNGA